MKGLIPTCVRARGAGGLALLLLCSWFPSRARAADVEPVHSLSAYVRGGVNLYLSDARSVGGLGAGLGLRDTIQNRFILQADFNYLTSFGNALALRVAAGVQRQGVYTPMLLLAGSVTFGDQVKFVTPPRSAPVEGPPIALGLAAAPLRWSLNQTQVSIFEVGLGIGWESPGIGLSYQLEILEIGGVF